MRLLRIDADGNLSFTKTYGSGEEVPSYAILSHTWVEDGEVSYDEFLNRPDKEKEGFTKIRYCAQQAKQDGLSHCWIDTCCINKIDEIELKDAISSMFRWYQNADKCYVFLSDVQYSKRKAEGQSDVPWSASFRASRWFTRGWTLQELLAPRSVEFFSKEWKRLGDKRSLETRIHEATRIPRDALQGVSLSRFSVNERLKWSEHRKTQLPEDRAYCLIGIFGSDMTPIYGEGVDGAFARLLAEANTINKCLQDLHLTDSRRDKKRIEATKGGLLHDLYCWILESSSFQQWRESAASRLLWIKGDAGKGKTMLVCGIIDELEIPVTSNVAFFFCQGTDSRLNNATAVLRSLIHQLVSQQPLLISYFRSNYEQAGRALFQDTNAWIALSEIFLSVIQDVGINEACLVVDALDECVDDLPKLLDLIVQTTSLPTRVKWLVSSRNEAHIDQKLKSMDDDARLSLELKQNAEQISRAVDAYIAYRVDRLESVTDESIRNQVRQELHRKAEGTFLWVALAMQELESPETWDPLAVVREAPPGLHHLYDRMLDRVGQLNKRNAEICQLLLATAVVAYRPLHLLEMGSLHGVSGQYTFLENMTKKIVAMCGSFLTIRDDHVYLVHQSAKDYLVENMRIAALPTPGVTHHRLYCQSLDILSSTLRRDVYRLVRLDCAPDDIEVPQPDPLVAARYACIHWINHLCDTITNGYDRAFLEDGTLVSFIQNYLLYWLESLSICKSIPIGIESITNLQALLEHDSVVMNVITDARRFMIYHKTAIEESPLQIYTSALLYRPSSSSLGSLFEKEGLDWVDIHPSMPQEWGGCIQTLEGHTGNVHDIAFSHDSKCLVSAGADFTVRIWDCKTGTSIQKLNRHHRSVFAVAISLNSSWIASALEGSIIELWDAKSGLCIKKFADHSGLISSLIFACDSDALASVSLNGQVKFRDIHTGGCIRTFDLEQLGLATFSQDVSLLACTPVDRRQVRLIETKSGRSIRTITGPFQIVTSVAFNHDSSQIAIVYRSYEDNFQHCTTIYDARDGQAVWTVPEPTKLCSSISFSHDSALLASGSLCSIHIWSVDNEKRKYVHCNTLEDHGSVVLSTTFAPNSRKMAAASADGTIRIWEDVTKHSNVPRHRHHSDGVTNIVFSSQATWLASASIDGHIRIWNAENATCELNLIDQESRISCLAFSHDSTRILAVSGRVIKLWHAKSGKCLQTYSEDIQEVQSIAFSHDATRFASISEDAIIIIWDTTSGEIIKTLEGTCVRDAVLTSTYPEAMLDDNTLAFSVDSTFLATASSVSWDLFCRTIEIWDLRSWQSVRTLTGHFSPVTSLAYSHDSIWLASSSIDHTVAIWSLETGACVQRFSIDRLLSTISFDPSDSCLHTDIGTFDLDTKSWQEGSVDDDHIVEPKYTGLKLSVDGIWIGYRSQNIIRVPPTYRGWTCAVRGDTIAIGTASGMVWIYKFRNLEERFPNA